MKLANKYPFILGLTALTATPAFAIDPCFLGTWQPDYLVFGEQYLDATGATGVTITGNMLMTFVDTGTGTYVAENLTFDVSNDGMPRTEVTLNGTGAFIADTTDGAFVITMGEFAYDAHAKVHMGGGEIMEMDIPFTNEMAPFGGAIGVYECSADVLEFQTTTTDGVESFNVAKRWTRL